jgi:hypothetical protein
MDRDNKTRAADNDVRPCGDDVAKNLGIDQR